MSKSYLIKRSKQEFMQVNVTLSELQITGGTEDNSKIIFLFLNENICCDPSLEPSQRVGSHAGSQHRF